MAPREDSPATGQPDERSDELLVGLLFDELSPAERERVEALLARHPELHQRLDRLRECVGPNCPAEGGPNAPAEVAVAGAECPAGLAARTIQNVLCPAARRVADAPTARCRSIVEPVTLAAAVLLVGALVGPALLASRESSHRIGCQANLELVGKGLFRYADDHGGYFPPIGPAAYAGMYSVALADSGYIDRDELRESLVCPSSPLAAELSRRGAAVYVPTTAEVSCSLAPLVDRLRRLMGGSYAYRLGYFDGPRYVTIKNRHDCRSPLLADAPGESCGADASDNHGGAGQNVLFQDGSVRFVTHAVSPSGDHYYLNNSGRVAAGESSLDAVLARSEQGPGRVLVVTVRRAE
ncbi:MAG: anti-sigma factor family protein [Lacipirellulaceae bacterium]